MFYCKHCKHTWIFRSSISRFRWDSILNFSCSRLLYFSCRASSFLSSCTFCVTTLLKICKTLNQQIHTCPTKPNNKKPKPKLHVIKCMYAGKSMLKNVFFNLRWRTCCRMPVLILILSVTEMYFISNLLKLKDSQK